MLAEMRALERERERELRKRKREMADKQRTVEADGYALGQRVMNLFLFFSIFSWSFAGGARPKLFL